MLRPSQPREGQSQGAQPCGLCLAGVTIGSIQNVMGVLYSATNFQGMFNLMNVLPVVGYERSVFYRCIY